MMRFRILSLILTLLPAVAYAGSSVPDEYDPQASPAAVVVSGNARFTVLTPRLVRLEWSADGRFEDRATLGVVNRRLEVPAFRVRRTKDGVVITTSALVLRYKGPGRFSEKNLSVTFSMADSREKKGVREVRWTPGADDGGNLMGTFRTLDGCKGFSQINSKGDPYEQGILSRDGWAVVDESTRHVLEKDGSDWGEWVAPRPEGERDDWYLFAYGHDYKAALADFTRIAGRIPLPPKFAFGYWWSRYWQYSDFEFIDLAREIRSHSIPMDVMVIDMDWHDTWTLQRSNPEKDEFGQRIGWTGYTWQKELFPDPAGTLRQLHGLNLKTSLNLHPASGIQPYEDCYEAFVKDYLSRTTDYDGPEGYRYHAGDSLVYLRSDPATRKDRTAREGEACPVPFRMDQQAWADAYFHSVIHPMERQGVDFWWLDWQQWKQSEYVPGLSNTFWLNYTFFNDKVRRMRDQGLSAPRPMIYHRWGGLGSHRYQIGFSGDCYDTWDVLRFLPYFTATSSNVGYGYWGHDIGGHQTQGDPYKPEIFTRWLQYGVFTPIYKTHSTKNADIERRIWTYAPEYSVPMREAVRLRYSLSPYIYNAARQAYDTGICLCRPMYYDYPENEESYGMKEQFLFGDDILATVVCEPVDAETGLAPRTVWFPAGNDWYDMATGVLYGGGQTLTLSYTLDENPWFVKAGAILPLADENITSLQEENDLLRFFIAPGEGKSECRLYEDDGKTQAYSRDFATTVVTKESSREACKVVVSAREGSYEGMLPQRRLQVILEGVGVPASVLVDGREASCSRYPGDTPDRPTWTYSGKDLAVVVTLPRASASLAQTVECRFDGMDPAVLRGKKGVFHRMMRITPAFKDTYNTAVDKYKLLSRPFLKLAQCASQIDSDPERLSEYLEAADPQAVEADLRLEADKIRARGGKDAETQLARLRRMDTAIQAQCNL